MAGIDFGRSPPLAILKTDSTGPSSEWPNGREWPNGFRPLKRADLQEERENGRMAEESTEALKTPEMDEKPIDSANPNGYNGGDLDYEYAEDE